MTHPNSDQHHHPPPVIMIISKVTSDHSCPRDIPNKTINTPPHKPKPSHNNARKFTRTPISSFFYARIETYVTGDLPVCFSTRPWRVRMRVLACVCASVMEDDVDVFKGCCFYYSVPRHNTYTMPHQLLTKKRSTSRETAAFGNKRNKQHANPN